MKVLPIAIGVPLTVRLADPQAAAAAAAVVGGPAADGSARPSNATQRKGGSTQLRSNTQPGMATQHSRPARMYSYHCQVPGCAAPSGLLVRGGPQPLPSRPVPPQRVVYRCRGWAQCGVHQSGEALQAGLLRYSNRQLWLQGRCAAWLPHPRAPAAQKLQPPPA